VRLRFLHLTIVALLFLGGTYLHAATNGFSPTLVQACGLSLTDCGGSHPSPSATGTYGFMRNVTSGNLEVVCINWPSTTITLTSVTGSLGTTYTNGPAQSASGSGFLVTNQCVYGLAASTGAEVVTITLSGSVGNGGPAAEVAEFTNISGTLDTSCTGSAASAGANITATCTTTVNGDLMVFYAGSCCGAGNGTVSMPIQFAGSSATKNDYMGWYVAGVAGSYGATYVQNTLVQSVQAFSGVLLAFKPSAITITTSAIADGAQTDAYHDFISCVGGAGAYTYSAVSGLPAWASVNSATGEITGTPNANATSSVQFRCTDGTNTANRTISLTVGSAFVTPTLVQTATSSGNVAHLLQPIKAGDLYVLTTTVQQRFSNLSFVPPASLIVDGINTVFHRVGPVLGNSGKGDAPVSNGIGLITYVGVAPVCAQSDTITQIGSFSVEVWTGLQTVVDDGTYLMQIQTANGNITSPSYTAVAPNELLHSALADGHSGDTVSITAPFTNAVAPWVSNQAGATGQRAVTATGAYTASGAVVGGSNSDTFAIQLLGLRPALAVTACASTVTQFEKDPRQIW
jgi:hypothetical protein